MEKRYRVLRFISFIYKLLAILILIGAIAMAVLTAVASRGTTIPGLPVIPTAATAVAPGVEATETAVGSLVPAVPGLPAGYQGLPMTIPLPTSGIGFAIMIFIGGLLWALGLYAVGDFISLLVATEQNTRAGAEYNRQAALMMREVAKRLGGGTGALR